MSIYRCLVTIFRLHESFFFFLCVCCVCVCVCVCVGGGGDLNSENKLCWSLPPSSLPPSPLPQSPSPSLSLSLSLSFVQIVSLVWGIKNFSIALFLKMHLCSCFVCTFIFAVPMANGSWNFTLLHNEVSIGNFKVEFHGSKAR